MSAQAEIVGLAACAETLPPTESGPLQRCSPDRIPTGATALVNPGRNADRYPLARPDVIAEARASNLTSATVRPLALHVPATLRPGWYPVIDLVQGSPEVVPCRGGRTTISGQLGTVVVRQLRQ